MNKVDSDFSFATNNTLVNRYSIFEEKLKNISEKNVIHNQQLEMEEQIKKN